jgi:hypothetical protein
MASYYVPSTGIVPTKENPFVQDLLVSEDVHTLKSGKNKDNGAFVYINIAKLNDITSLSKRAQKAFQVLMQEYSKDTCGAKKTNDMVTFNFRMAQESEWKPSKDVFRSAINELCHKQFLCPVADAAEWYWINPTIFYRGNRLAVVNLYVQEGAKK